jgi:hypothetical protein
MVSAPIIEKEDNEHKIRGEQSPLARFIMIIKKQLTLNSKRPPFPDTTRIQIRLANIFDINDIMLHAFILKGKSPICHIIEPIMGEADMTDYRKLCLSSIKSGRLVLVAENKDGIKGFIFGSIMPSIWGNNSRVLEEIGFIAESKRAAYLLLHHYIELAQELKDNGEIHMFSIGELPTTNLNYEKLGLKLIEKYWAG